MNFPRMMRTRYCTGMLVTMALGALPGVAAAADDVAGRVAEVEMRLEQQQAERQMHERERTQREALRGQEEAIRRLEEARRRLEASTREVAQLSSELGRNFALAPSVTALAPPPRALLGVVVSNDRAREGALVREVSPGGAAAEAGIRAGDVIVALDGRDLTGGNDPSGAVLDFMRQVEPDRKVRVEVLRDGRRMGFDVTPRPTPGVDARVFQFRRPDGVSSAGPFFERLGSADGGARFDGMEFATLSERLGKYFGVTAGVLVVRAGPDAPFGLQDGDVVLSVDGRVPSNAQHLGRILRSYQPGEKVKLRVQRDHKAIDLDSTAPGRARPAPR
jgi:C-terminal processing protease CtpA/Prc